MAEEIAALSKIKAIESEVTEAEEVPEEKGVSILVILGASGITLLLTIIAAVVINKRRMEHLGAEVVFGKKVKLLQLSGGEEQFDFSIKDEIKIGRSRRCHISLKDDKALSEVHCSLWWKQGGLYVQDGDSTNGTYVNGIPVVGEYKLEQGDILLIGSYEYRVSWVG